MFKKLISSKAMRKRTSLLLAVVLVPPFIFFFHMFTGNPSGSRHGVAGVLFGRRIPWEQFEEQSRLVRQKWQRQLGEIPADLEPSLRQETWDRLLLLDEVRRRHLRVTDRELAAAIQAIPTFQDDGRFVRDRYYRALHALGMSPQLFEASMRDSLLIERVIQQVTADVTVTDEDVRAAYRAAHKSPEGREPDMSGFELEAPALRQRLLTERRGQQFLTWLDDLRARAKIRSFVDDTSERVGE